MLLIFYFPVLSCANTILLKLELHAEEALFLFIFFFFPVAFFKWFKVKFVN